MKRLTAFLTAVVMCLFQLTPLSMISMMVYAETAPVPLKTTITSGAISGPGDEVTAVISLGQMRNLWTISLNITYDANVMTLKTENIKPLGYLKANQAGVVIPAQTKIDQYESGTADAVKVSYADEGNAVITGDLVELTFTIKDTVKNGTYPISVSASELYYLEDDGINYGELTPEAPVPGGDQEAEVEITGGISTVSTLKKLTIDGCTLAPAFSSNVTAYTATVPFGKSVPTIAKANAVPTDSKATVAITQATSFEEGENVATIVVTAASGDAADSTTYTITFVAQEQTETPVISPSDTVIKRDTEITITGNGTIYYTTSGATPQPGADGTKVYTGSIKPADIVPLNVNELTITAVAVEEGKAASEQAQMKYTLPDADFTLSALTVNGVSVEGFDPAKFEYTYEVSYKDWKDAKDKIYTIAATPKNPDAVVLYSENDFALAGDSEQNTLKEATVTVTSVNGDSGEYKITFVVLACVHDMDLTDTVPAECLTAGKETYTCTVCGHIEEKELAALGHSYKESGHLDAACETAGYDEYTCERCGDTYRETIPATGHDWDEGKVTLGASCEIDGNTHYVCKNDPTHTKDEPKPPKTGHKWGFWTKDETLPDTYYRVCENDNNHRDVKTAAEIDHEHNFNGGNVVPVKSPTCSEKGLQYVYCTYESCPEYVEEELDMLPHTPGEAEIVTAPDCVNIGKSQVKCTVCGNVLEENDIPAIGHTYGEAWESDAAGHWHVCSVCGEKSAREAHVEDGGVVTTPATQEAEGVRTYSCTICGAQTRTETIAKLPEEHTHTPSTEGGVAAWSSDINGHWQVCECGEVLNYSAHTDLVNVVVTEATATTTGLVESRCSVCGYVVATNVIPATGSNTPGQDTPGQDTPGQTTDPDNNFNEHAFWAAVSGTGKTGVNNETPAPKVESVEAGAGITEESADTSAPLAVIVIAAVLGTAAAALTIKRRRQK